MASSLEIVIHRDTPPHELYRELPGNPPLVFPVRQWVKMSCLYISSVPDGVELIPVPQRSGGVESLLYVALDVNYIQPSEFERLYLLAEQTISLIAGFTAYLRKKQ